MICALPPRYNAHPLVRAFARARLAERPAEEAALRVHWLAWATFLAGQVGFCWSDLSRLDLLDADHPTVQAALKWAAAIGSTTKLRKLRMPRSKIGPSLIGAPSARSRRI